MHESIRRSISSLKDFEIILGMIGEPPRQTHSRLTMPKVKQMKASGQKKTNFEKTYDKRREQIYVMVKTILII